MNKKIISVKRISRSVAISTTTPIPAPKPTIKQPQPPRPSIIGVPPKPIVTVAHTVSQQPHQHDLAFIAHIKEANKTSHPKEF